MSIQIMVEAKLGIDPKTSSLVTPIDEYFIYDENGSVIPTGYRGDIPGNLWAVDVNGSYYLTGAGTSEVWELDPSGATVLK
jgi:hypothetical protein